MEINTGISAEQRSAIVQSLSRLLADTYVLYLKTHSFHWNVEGPMFQTLHQMFMDQYTETWNAIDFCRPTMAAKSSLARAASSFSNVSLAPLT